MAQACLEYIRGTAAKEAFLNSASTNGGIKKQNLFTP